MAAPNRGDLVWLDFDPQAGHEQAGRRPALVISPRVYHQRSHLAIVCPVTTNRRGSSFEVPLPPGLLIEGVVMVDQIKSVDRLARRIEPAGKVPEMFMEEILERLMLLLAGVSTTDTPPQ